MQLNYKPNPEPSGSLVIFSIISEFLLIKLFICPSLVGFSQGAVLMHFFAFICNKKTTKYGKVKTFEVVHVFYKCLFHCTFRWFYWLCPTGLHSTWPMKEDSH